MSAPSTNGKKCCHSQALNRSSFLHSIDIRRRFRFFRFSQQSRPFYSRRGKRFHWAVFFSCATRQSSSASLSLVGHRINDDIDIDDTTSTKTLLLEKEEKRRREIPTSSRRRARCNNSRRGATSFESAKKTNEYSIVAELIRACRPNHLFPRRAELFFLAGPSAPSTTKTT
jgi:hypothetical protein